MLSASIAPAEDGPEEGEPHDSAGAELMESALEDLEVAKQHLIALEEKARPPEPFQMREGVHNVKAQAWPFALHWLGSYQVVVRRQVGMNKLHNNPRPQQADGFQIAFSCRNRCAVR